MARLAASIKRRPVPFVVGIVLVLAIVALVAVQIATRIGSAQLIEALGPHAHWSAMDVGLFRIVITDFSEDAEDGWPTDKEVTAKQVVLTPRLSSLLTRRPVIVSDVVASDGTAVLLREKGGLAILPMLTRRDQPKPAAVSSEPKLWIQKMRFERFAVDFYDRTVSAKNYKIHFEPDAGTIAGFRLPVAGSRLDLSFASPVIAPSGQQSGTFSISGAFMPHQGSDLQIELQGVGVDVVGPYMAKAGSTGISSGSLDLSARSQVQDGKINATGVLTLHHLEVKTGGGLTDTVLGAPRTAVIDQLKNRNGDVVLHFSLAGDEHDPKFSLNESLETKLSAGFAEALGLPLQGIAKGVGSLGEQGLDAAGHAVSNVGDAVKGLFQH
jgi:hypothetical protein